MPGHRYGVLRGQVVATAEERDDHVSPHYQIHMSAAGEDWRVAVNVQSTDRSNGREGVKLLYRIIEGFEHAVIGKVKALEEGFTRLEPKADSGALDYVRGGLFDRKDMRLAPADRPGDGNDLNDMLADCLGRAIRGEAALFAFGCPWPRENRPDKVFGFRPARGLHDVHMNQGNSRAGGHADDNGVWGDGGLLLWFPETDRWTAVFLAFQGQSWRTDDRTGQPLGD